LDWALTKLGQIKMKLLEALDWRYAVKQFSDEKITMVKVKTSLNATRLIASSYGLKPYIALGNFLTCAAMMKIDSCPMTGFDNAGYDGVLDLAGKGLTTSVICPIGRRHRNDVQALSPKVRFDYEQIVREM
jgi:nitroreductase